MKARIWNVPAVVLWLSAAVTSVQSATSAPHQSGVIGWWPGDGTARDIVGGNNGTLQFGAAFAPGVVKQAFALDGINDYVSIPHSEVLNPKGAFSVVVWIKANPVQSSPDGQFLIVDKSHGWAPPATGWLLQGNPEGTVAFGFGDGGYDAGPPGYPTVSNRTSVLDNTWHHLAGVFTGTQVQIYLDGRLENARALSIRPAGNTREMEIGRSWGGPYGATRYFRGLIDEVMLYNRAISAGEVAEVFSAGTAGKREPPGIVKQPSGKSSVVKTEVKTEVGSSVTSSATAPKIRPTGTSIALYAGVTIEGEVGQTYGIEYTADMSNTNGWRGAANVILTEPIQVWFDTQSANQPQRYYRVVPGPISIP